MCLLRCVALLFVCCLAAAQYSAGGPYDEIILPIFQLVDDDSTAIDKRALNPFTDSVGKRYVHPPTGIRYRPAAPYGMLRGGVRAHHAKNGQLEVLPTNKRQFFDSLAGQTLGKRRYFDAVAFEKEMEK